ncbi:hypothetical protein BST44_20110 [Mycobacterium scrofulaceum]|uniref:NAD(P)-binding domain-containing protein n=1 Tax=Mycobacterium scrofulaceum TaxID=1783 RepID=A0A1X0KAG5_MYCSC|nr:hypothetical protein BST44_20110 [Mycobacterium scrofulaceum]
MMSDDTRIARDWGLVREHIDAMSHILQHSTDADVAIATGEGHTLEAFVQTASEQVAANWHERMGLSEALQYASHRAQGMDDGPRARDIVSRLPTYRMTDFGKAMVDAQLTGGKRL